MFEGGFQEDLFGGFLPGVGPVPVGCFGGRVQGDALVMSGPFPGEGAGAFSASCCAPPPGPESGWRVPGRGLVARTAPGSGSGGGRGGQVRDSSCIFDAPRPGPVPQAPKGTSGRRCTVLRPAVLRRPAQVPSRSAAGPVPRAAAGARSGRLQRRRRPGAQPRPSWTPRPGAPLRG